MNNLRGDVLAAASVIMMSGTLWALFYVDFPDSSKDVLLVVIGVLTTIVKDVYSFEFGASKSGERSAKVVVDTMKDAAATATRVAADLAATPDPVAVTPAPMNPMTGVIPAVEVASDTTGKKI